MEKITAYRLVIDDGLIIKRFLTMDSAEASIKAIEVMQENNQVNIGYYKFKTSKELFMKELQEIIS